jgi:hypothetical protein
MHCGYRDWQLATAEGISRRPELTNTRGSRKPPRPRSEVKSLTRRSGAQLLLLGGYRPGTFPSAARNSFISTSSRDRVTPSCTARIKLRPSRTRHPMAASIVGCPQPQEYKPSLSIQQASYRISGIFPINFGSQYNTSVVVDHTGGLF